MFNIEQLIAYLRKTKIREIIVVDTNILMYEPLISQWKIPIKDVIFIIPGVVAEELVKLTKTGDYKTKPAAQIARRESIELFNENNNVIEMPGIGYSMLVQRLPRELTESEVKRYKLSVDAVGIKDFELVLLVKYIQENINDAHVRLATADKGLITLTNTHGVNYYHFKKNNSWKDLTRSKPKIVEIEWEAIFNEIMQNQAYASFDFLSIQNKTEKVEDFDSDVGLKIAKGVGQLSYQLKEYPFSWKIQYQPYNIVSMLFPLPATTSIDFKVEKDDLPKQVADKVKSILETHTLVDSNHTLQSPTSIMLFNLYLEYLRKNYASDKGAYVESYEIFKDKDRNASLQKEFAHHMIKEKRKYKPQALIDESIFDNGDAADECVSYIFNTYEGGWADDKELMFNNVFGSIFERWEAGDTLEQGFKVYDI
jgi:rRNA-processing protein FCF1